MKLPPLVLLKDFLGLYVLTPFEEDLLEALAAKLPADLGLVLRHQLATFTTNRRLIKHLDEPGAHGYTMFYTLKWGKDCSEHRQIKRFPILDEEAILATADVTFEGGQIEVKFWLVRGIFFMLEYRSPQKIYYPPSKYEIQNMKVLI